MTRYKDWWIQARADLKHAKDSLKGEAYEWACFAAQQAVEKALKAVFEKRGEQIWGYSITRMLQVLQKRGVKTSDELIESGKILDKHYIPTRYPSGYFDNFEREQLEISGKDCPVFA